MASFWRKTVYTSNKDILYRWSDHFSTLLNRTSFMNQDCLDLVADHPQRPELAKPPTHNTVHRAVKSMGNWKAPGLVGIPAEVYKYGGDKLLHNRLGLYKCIWDHGTVPQDFKDLFSLLNAKTKVHHICVTDLLYADDSAFVAHSEAALQKIIDTFSAASEGFGLSLIWFVT